MSLSPVFIAAMCSFGFGNWHLKKASVLHYDHYLKENDIHAECLYSIFYKDDVAVTFLEYKLPW